MKRCICCQVSERYRPGEWTRGVFVPARWQGVQPPGIEGDVCPLCVVRCQPVKVKKSAAGPCAPPDGVRLSLFA